jgi:hypothetical protein
MMHGHQNIKLYSLMYHDARSPKHQAIFNNDPPPPPTLTENRAVYEKLWKSMVQPDRPQMTIWRMRFVCWIIKATYLHSEYVILIALPLQQSLYERSSMLRHTYVASLVACLKLQLKIYP